MFDSNLTLTIDDDGGVGRVLVGEVADVPLRMLLELCLVVAAAHLALKLVRSPDLTRVQLVSLTVKSHLQWVINILILRKYWNIWNIPYYYMVR